MITATEAYFRTELIERRHLLSRATRDSHGPDLSLLADVDAALARLDDGAFGVCDVCDEYVGTSTLHTTRWPAAARSIRRLEKRTASTDLRWHINLRSVCCPATGSRSTAGSFATGSEAASEVAGLNIVRCR